MDHLIKITNTYLIWCTDKHGNIKWAEEVHNLIPTEGLNKIVDAAYVTGASAPFVFAGLLATGAVLSAANTMGSHAAWTENVDYSETTRQVCTFSAVASGVTTNSALPATFNINNTCTIAGSFLCLGSSTKGGSDGTIMGELLFSSEKDLISGDKVYITATITATSI